MADQWYYTSNGQQMNPVSREELKELAAAGRLKPTDYIWKEGMPDWAPASSASGLFSEGAVMARPPVKAALPAKREPDVYQLETRAEETGPKPVRDDVLQRRSESDAKEDEDAEDEDEYTRERRRRRRTQPPVSNTVIVAICLGVGIIFIGAVAGVIWLITRAGASGEEVDAVALVREYQRDRIAADLKYKGKTLVVHGRVMARNGNAIALETNLPSVWPGARPGATDVVVAYFNNVRDCANVGIGSTVKVKGRCDGFDQKMDVELRNCRITETGNQVALKPGNPEVKVDPPPKVVPPPKVMDPPIKQFDPPVNIVDPPVNNPKNPSKADEVLRVSGRLTKTDPFDRARPGCRHKVHSVRLSAGQVYTIDLIGNGPGQFGLDTFLRLENSKGIELAQDDDSGGNLNARIVFQPTQDDDYRIIATTFAPGATGSYTLIVRKGR